MHVAIIMDGNGRWAEALGHPRLAGHEQGARRIRAVVESAPALGIDVPGDVSVAGFDDISTAALTAPSLSTVRLPLREMGRRGFEHAHRLLAGDESSHELLPTEVILRASTAAPAAVALPDALRPAAAERAS